MRSPLSLLLLAFGLSLALSWWLDPLRTAATTTDPQGRLAQLAKEDSDLGTALAAADRGDATVLIQWLNRADPLRRQHLAGLISNAAGAQGKDIRTVYAARYRLLPFTIIPTGKPALDTELDNLVAYALVTGVRPVVPSELVQAQAIAQRMAAPALAAKDHARLDTMGCVRFMAGDATGAVESFTKAVKYAEELRVEAGILDLYRRRKAAAERLATDPTEALPLDWPTP